MCPGAGDAHGGLAPGWATGGSLLPQPAPHDGLAADQPGYSLKLIGEVLGHRSLQAANRYAHLRVSAQRAALLDVFGERPRHPRDADAYPNRPSLGSQKWVVGLALAQLSLLVGMAHQAPMTVLTRRRPLGVFGLSDFRWRDSVLLIITEFVICLYESETGRVDDGLAITIVANTIPIACTFLNRFRPDPNQLRNTSPLFRGLHGNQHVFKMVPGQFPVARSAGLGPKLQPGRLRSKCGKQPFLRISLPMLGQNPNDRNPIRCADDIITFSEQKPDIPPLGCTRPIMISPRCRR